MGEGLKRAFNAARETRRTLSPAQRSVLAFLASDPGRFISYYGGAPGGDGGRNKAFYWTIPDGPKADARSVWPLVERGLPRHLGDDDYAITNEGHAALVRDGQKK